MPWGHGGAGVRPGPWPLPQVRPDVSWPSAAGSVKLALAQFLRATDLVNYKEGTSPAIQSSHPQQGADCAAFRAGGGPDAPGQVVTMVRWGGHRGQ